MKKTTKKILGLFLVLALSVGLIVGCSNDNDTPEEVPTKAADTEAADTEGDESNEDEASSGEKKRIGVSLIYKGDEWCAAVDEEFYRQADDYNFEVNVQDGDINDEVQLRQIENFIAQDYDLIALDPATAEGSIPASEKVTEADIPLLIFDSASAYEDIVSFVSWDSYETGQLIGGYLKDKIEKEYDGKANIAVLTMASPVTIAERIQGFKDALEGLDITYVAEQDYEGNRELAANIVTNIKEDVDFIISGQDNGAWGAVSALQAMGNTTTEVYSMGAFGEEPFTALQANDSNYKGTVAVSPSSLVRSSYDVMTAYFNGETDIADRVDIELDLVTVENINEYLEANHLEY